MKLVPGSLPPIPTTNTTMDRLPLPLPFSPDLLWRYPLGFSSLTPNQQQQQSPSSPLFDYKSQLPASLASDPLVWSRDDVLAFLRWAEREFDLQPIDSDMFQMNGKALCLLTRSDFAERTPSSGDVLHNVLQLLLREANNLQRVLPSSPVTPTTRYPNPFSPYVHSSTPKWNFLGANGDQAAFHTSHAIAAHLMAQSNSVTLSPAPSVDSQAGSPQHADSGFGHSVFGGVGGGSSGGGGSNASNGSNPSDSDEDGYEKKTLGSPPNTPSAYTSWQLPPHASPRSPKETPTTGQSELKFFPSDSPEPNTNGRLLWDFLQQLLNDPSQRYTNYIAWKNRDAGVFKIVDPAGLAKLWGIQKNHLSMNYDKMSRALRYYYRVNILKKVQGERHCYQFLRNPTELKNIKNISLLRQVSPSETKINQMLPNVTVKPEVVEMNHETKSNGDDYDEKPTDLSIKMEGPTDLSNGSQQHVNIVCSPDPPISTSLY